MVPEPGNRCVFYCRYSSEGQKESSIERQIDACQAYATRNGLIPVNDRYIFADRGRSGYYLTERDDLAKLRELARIDGKGFDKLICEDLDRLSRNIIHVLQIYEELKSRGIEIHVTGGGIGRVDDVHAVFYGLIGMEQRTRMLRLMSQGSWRAALRGQNVGSVPYGYRRGSEAGILLLHDDQAPVVQRIFHLFDVGLKAGQIARLLNAEGVPSASKAGWTRNSIIGSAKWGNGILRNPKYVGVGIYGRTERVRNVDTPSTVVSMRSSSRWAYAVNTEWAIVDRDLWLRVLTRLKKLNDKSSERKPWEKSSSKATLIFHGSYYCTCGARLRGAFKDRSTGRDMYCSNAAEKGECNRRRQTSANFIECEILREIRDTILTSADLPAYIEEYKSELRRLEDAVSLEVESRRRRIEKIDDWLVKSIDVAINKGGSNEHLERARELKNAERAEHRLALAGLPDLAKMPKMELDTIPSIRDGIDALIRRIPTVAETEADLVLVQTLRRLVPKVVIDREDGMKGYALEITFRPSSLVTPENIQIEGLPDTITVRRPCDAPTSLPANLAERQAVLYVEAASGRHAMSDSDWGIVEPVFQHCRSIDARLTLNAANFYLISEIGLSSLPPPYDGPSVYHGIRRMVWQGDWRRAYSLLAAAGSATVEGLDTTRFIKLESRGRSDRPRRDR
jgi:DNA invertase Pin-like site-specific DNA recombinase